MAGPDVRYAKNAGISIAYQVFGQGPRDLIIVCGTMSHLELFWQDPRASAMLERLARFSRVLLFDKPGIGLSDPIPAAPTIDQRTADIIAVMDAAGSERAVVVGYSEGGFPAMMLAASRPPARRGARSSGDPRRHGVEARHAGAAPGLRRHVGGARRCV